MDIFQKAPTHFITSVCLCGVAQFIPLTSPLLYRIGQYEALQFILRKNHENDFFSEAISIFDC
jgi:hypothetical protein